MSTTSKEELPVAGSSTPPRPRDRPSPKPPNSQPDRPRGPLNETWKFFLANLPPSVTADEMRRHFEVRGLHCVCTRVFFIPNYFLFQFLIHF
jgi:RNA recognition motif-containing protein